MNPDIVRTMQNFLNFFLTSGKSLSDDIDNEFCGIAELPFIHYPDIGMSGTCLELSGTGKG